MGSLMLTNHKIKGFTWLIFIVLSAGLLVNATPANAAKDQGKCENVYFTQARSVNGSSQTCHFDPTPKGTDVNADGCLDTSGLINMVVEGLAIKTAGAEDYAPYSSPVFVNIKSGVVSKYSSTVSVSGGNFTLSLPSDLLQKTNYSYEIKTQDKKTRFDGGYIYVTQACTACLTDIPTGASETYQRVYSICDQVPVELVAQKEKCEDCVGGDGENYGIWTAIGCIPRDPETIVSVFLRFGLGMGGGVALLMILGSGFMMTVSQGDPKQIDTAKQWLTSAIAGLLFIIFSVTILQFIGYSVFQIPGFGG